MEGAENSITGILFIIALSWGVLGIWFVFKLNSIDKNIRSLAETSRKQLVIFSRPGVEKASSDSKPTARPVSKNNSVMDEREKFQRNLEEFS